jgi:D-alanyl-D-alanine carboxypeptidase (penicillin-binding protein 5/6)
LTASLVVAHGHAKGVWWQMVIGMGRGKATDKALRLLLAAAILASAGGIVDAPARPGPFLSTAYADVWQDDEVGGMPLSQRAVADAPSVMAPCALVAAADGTILWERGGSIRVPIASTTKMMTCIVALESADIGKECLITKGAAETGGTSAWILQGDVILLGELLYGLMLPSGNDAAVAIAENVAGTVFEFVDMMNAKAAELGMRNTHFVDPNGLDEDGCWEGWGPYSTVEDYLILTRYCMRNRTFREIVGHAEATIHTVDGRQIDYQSTNRLFWGMEGVIGIKTGTNYESHACLVAAVERNGATFYSVVFGSPTDEGRYIDTRALLEWAFKHYRPVELINSTTLVGDMALSAWVDKTVPVRVPYPVIINVFDLGGPIEQEVQLADWPDAVSRGEKVGRIIWTQSGEVLATQDLVADLTVDAPDFWEGFSLGWERLKRGPFGDDMVETQTYLPGIFEIPPAF